MDIDPTNSSFRIVPCILSSVPIALDIIIHREYQSIHFLHRFHAEFIERMVVHIVETGYGALFQRIDRLRHRTLVIRTELEVGGKREDAILAVDEVLQLHIGIDAQVGMLLIKVLVYKAGVVSNVFPTCIELVERIEHIFHLIGMIECHEIGTFLLRQVGIKAFRFFCKLQPCQIALCHLFGEAGIPHRHTFTFRTSYLCAFGIIHYSHGAKWRVGVQIHTFFNVFPLEFHLHLVEVGVKMRKSFVLEHYSFHARIDFITLHFDFNSPPLWLHCTYSNGRAPH